MARARWVSTGFILVGLKLIDTLKKARVSMGMHVNVVFFTGECAERDLRRRGSHPNHEPRGTDA